MYIPEAVIVPALHDHVTEVLVVPLTVAENCCADPTWREMLEGDTETETDEFPEPVPGAMAPVAPQPDMESAINITNTRLPKSFAVAFAHHSFLSIVKSSSSTCQVTLEMRV